MEQPSQNIYDFHLVNIHERTKLAMICRGLPLFLSIGWIIVLGWGMYKSTQLLLVMSAVTNVAMWMWIVSNALLCLYGLWLFSRFMPLPSRIEDETNNVVHVCVIPNYKEDEEMLAETLQSLAECHLARKIRVMLAMEAREGEPARRKGERLQRRFENAFADLSMTLHPGDLEERHLDGSSDFEVPGKASNLKWAVRVASEECERDGIKASDVLLTVMDADCLLHPRYFWYIGAHHNQLKETSKNEEHLWTGYQAPQAAFRNFYESPVFSRTWGYISTFMEMGGTSSLDWGGQHMTFSSYTLPLQLLISAGLWSGDVVAEDHHIYIRCMFHSMRSRLLRGPDAHPLLQLHHVPLPVKSTSVISDEGYWKSAQERFHQAVRHAQGLSEFEFALQACFTMIGTAPCSWSYLYIAFRKIKLLSRLICIHCLPFLQSITLFVVTLKWFYHKGEIPECPTEIWFVNADAPEFFLCGLAGAWALMWPMVVPFFLVMLANISVIWYVFVKPGRTERPVIWDKEDGKVQPICGSQLLTVLALVVVDCAFLIMPIMAIYGLVPMLRAYFTTFYLGNRITYVTASKASAAYKESDSLEKASMGMGSYGAIEDMEIPKKGPRPPMEAS